jgi:hypothetical protein
MYYVEHGILQLLGQTVPHRMKTSPLKRDSKAQNKGQRSIVKTCKNTKEGFAFSTYLKHNSAI